MENGKKKSLKHKLQDALATTNSAKKKCWDKLPSSSSQDDSGISLSQSSKKSSPARKRVKPDSTNSAKRRLNVNSLPNESNIAELDIAQLLALGENNGVDASVDESCMSIDGSDSEGNDWEEVNEGCAEKDPVIPKDGVNITLEAPIVSFKKKKRQVDLQAEIQRQLKRRQKEIQELKHKVHLLGWIAHIKYVNIILNSGDLMKECLALVTSQNLYPPKRADCDYLERVVNWFSKKIVIADEVKRGKTSMGLLQELKVQFSVKTAFTKRDLVLMFVVFLRSLGVQCRLVFSLVTVPLKPSGDKNIANTNKSKKSETAEPESEEEDWKLRISKAFSSNKPDLLKASTTKAESIVIKPKIEETVDCNESKNVGQPAKKIKVESAASKRKEAIKCSKEKNTPIRKSTRGKGSVGEIKSNSKEMKSSSSKKDVKSIIKSDEKVANEESDPQPSTSRSPIKTRARLARKASANESKSKQEMSCTLNNKVNNLSKEENADPAKNGKSRISNNIATSKVSTKQKVTRQSRRITPLQPDSEEEEFSKHFKSPKKEKSFISEKKHKKLPSPIKEEVESDDDFTPPKESSGKKKLDRRVLSSDDDNTLKATKKRIGQDHWVEVFLEAEEKWITVDIVKKKIHCIRQLYSRATTPVTYILACNNDSTIKDVTKRYVPNWHSDTRKRRVCETWWQESLWPYLPPSSAREKEEDEDIARQLMDMPLPKSISEYKFHPLYALKRHLLKFEGIYPPEAPTLGFIRNEPVYARECVVTLRSREIWFKEARVVRANETPYKVVKSRPKYDKMTGDWRRDLPLELFGIWQTEDYDPPTAVDGKVPRNEYGNVDLFKPCMLPKGTVHLQVPALNRVAKKLGIDCAPAVVGFEFHSGGSHPVHDGFVVCEEFKDVLMDAWNKEIDESAKRNEEKREKRVYGNWRRLIRGLFIREKLKIKYAFSENPDDASTSVSTQYISIKKNKETQESDEG